MKKRKIGIIVNPIAGVGAGLAWKGSDDVDKAWKYASNPSTQPIWKILERAMSFEYPDDLEMKLTGTYPVEIPGKQVYEMPIPSFAEHTKQAVQVLKKEEVDLIVFAGGDGTAADIAEIVGDIPILGIPGGVKIFSPCFVEHPSDLKNVILGWDGETMAVDVYDLDEEQYVKGEIHQILVGSVKIPLSHNIQRGKLSVLDQDPETFKLIASRIKEENFVQDRIILLGPGTTIKTIVASLGIEKTLLGVDVLSDGKIIAEDCTTEELNKYDVDEVWLTPIGNQGSLIGRGNRQIPNHVFEKIKRGNIRVFATPEKLRETPTLFVDTGNDDLDSQMKGYIKVITGYHEEVVRKIE